MDPLSEVLSVLRPDSYIANGFDFGGDWCIEFPQPAGIKCYAIVKGECWLKVEGIDEPLHLRAGDCYLLPRGVPFRMASDLSLPPADIATMFCGQPNGRIRTWNGGGCMCVGGYFRLTGDARVLLQELPPIVHVREESDKAELRWLLDRMRQELADERPGASIVAEHLATMLLVLVLRLQVTEGAQRRVGWLFALADAQMRAAITLVHERPAERWTLETLAAKCGMSRSVFALKFKQTVGTSPMEYLTRWRMLLAKDRLVRTVDPVSSIAASLGYDSESAFSKAFRREMGLSPRQVRRSVTDAAVLV